MGMMDLQTTCNNIFVFANYLILKFIFRVLSWVPASTAEKVSHVIARLWFNLDSFHREIALYNLGIAFGHEKSNQEIEQIAKKSFFNTVNMVFESARAFQWNTRDIKKNMRVEGLQYLNAAQNKGKGTLLLTGHVGNWEHSLFIADLTPYEITGVYKKQKIEAVEKFVFEKRISRGGRMYPLKKAIEGILTELDQGNLIGLLIDHNAKTRGVFVDFFGKVASTEKGLAQLALTTRAPVVPYFVIKRDGGYVVEVLPEVPLIDTGNMEADILANTLQYNKIIESVIRRYPDQWLWVHRRWKTRPKGE
jgi:KDO2-lipid IV(A) lauroyltransferase